VNLGDVFAETGYINDSTRVWGNSNISANFPYVAQIQVALWKLQSGQQLDGVMATDPVALSYILGVTGPATLPGGESISADNVVRSTEVDSYARFPDNLKFPTSTQRKDYLQSVSRAVSQKVLAGSGGHTMALLQALGKSAGEGRLAVWSTRPAEQAVLGGTPLGRQVPDDAAPYANLIVNNTSHGRWSPSRWSSRPLPVRRRCPFNRSCSRCRSTPLYPSAPSRPAGHHTAHDRSYPSPAVGDRLWREGRSFQISRLERS